MVRSQVALTLGFAAALALPAAGAAPSRSTLSHAKSGARPATTILVRTPGRAISAFAISGRRLVWESGPINAENVPTLLLERDIGGGRTRVLSRSVDPTAGLVSTPDWVGYVAASGRTLLAVRHDGTHRHVLARNLLTAVAGRGSTVAWAEEDGDRQRVVSLNLATGDRRLIASLPRCLGTDCYRLDYVTLADDGVVFTRGAIGPQPSFVYRRARGRPLEHVRLPGDPQPDLVPSSDGALYYYYAHGWYRWDFNESRPRLTRVRTSEEPLAFEHGTWFFVTRSGCRSTIERSDTTGRAGPEVSAADVVRLTRASSTICAMLANFKAVGAREISAWILQPGYAIGAHIDFGLVGALVSTRVP